MTSSSTSTWSAAPRSTPTARRSPTRCWRRAAGPTPCCWRRSAARSGTPSTRTRRGPSRACSACARASGCSPTCARSGPAPALLDASPLKRDRIEGTDLLVVRELTGGHLLRRVGRATGTTPTTTAPTAWPRSSASPGWPSSPRATKVTSVDKANVLETSRLWRETVSRVRGGRVPRHAARAHAGGQRRDAAGLAARGLRRDRDREPVRRHPQRRGGDAHRLAGDAAQRLAGRAGCARPVRARARLGARTSPAPGRPIRWRCSARWR